jgi:hypothetical protein
MNEATLQYVRQHADDDVRQLALRGSKDPEVDVPVALQQIAGLQTARRKLPTWAATEGILFPPHLSLEQCSSEQTALYKRSVCRDLVATCTTHCSLIDLTGGFGVDFSFLAPIFDQAVYVEQQEALCRLACHNFPLLGLSSCSVVCANGADHLHHTDHATLIFLDPARRDAHGARTYGISDCTPDVLALRDELIQKADFVMLKLSPMLDWRKTVSDLGEQWVKEVHIVSAGGECKELLVVLSKEPKPNGLRLVCANDDDLFEVPTQPVSPVSVMLPLSPSSYLYEPNPSIMKAGCFAELSAHFSVIQIAQNSHLFFADRLIASFPGRKFQIEAISTLNKKELKEKILPLRQASITVRNFPLSVAELRKRLKLSEGGSHYIFATTLANGDHVLIVCRRA